MIPIATSPPVFHYQRKQARAFAKRNYLCVPLLGFGTDAFASARDNKTNIMATQKWNEVMRGSIVTLAKSKTLKGINGKPRKLEAGEYYINGFWADICGLAFAKSPRGTNDVCIQSRELTAFEGIN